MYVFVYDLFKNSEKLKLSFMVFLFRRLITSIEVK